MHNLLKPIIYGVIATYSAIIALWLTIPFLLSSFVETSVTLFPFLIIVPSLILGGFIAANKMHSKHISRYLIIGGIVGIVVMLIAITVIKTKGEIWFISVVVLSGVALSIFGAFIGAKKELSNEQQNP